MTTTRKPTSRFNRTTSRKSSSTAVPPLHTATTILPGQTTTITRPNGTLYELLCKDCSDNLAEIAGSAVGAAVGAAFLAFFITFFLIRRRLGSRNLSHKDRDSSKSDTVLGKGISGTVENDSEGTLLWMQHLPQRADDKTIERTAITLYDHVELHVDNFYDNLSDVRLNEAAKMEMLKLDTKMVTPSLWDAISRTRKKTALIKHALAYLILSRIDLKYLGKESFLPSEFANLMSLVQVSKESKPAMPQALSLQRVLMSYLCSHLEENREYVKQRDDLIEAAALTVCTAFAPLAKSRHSHETRYENLVEIMRNASRVEILLFRQPANYEFKWKSLISGEGLETSDVEVLPAFVRTTDDFANKLNIPRLVVNSRVE